MVGAVTGSGLVALTGVRGALAAGSEAVIAGLEVGAKLLPEPVAGSIVGKASLSLTVSVVAVAASAALGADSDPFVSAGLVAAATGVEGAAVVAVAVDEGGGGAA